VKRPLLARAFAIGAVASLILIPIALIHGKISERQARAQQVLRQFASETSGPQLIAGPFLAVTCEETYVEERQVMRGGKAETVAETKTRRCSTGYFAPKNLKATTTLPVEERHRGIYPIRLYRAEVELAGELEWPDVPPAHRVNARAWKHAYVVLYVSDPRGIKRITSSLSQSLLAAPGERDIAAFGVREDAGEHGERKPGTSLPFHYKMSLVGTSSLQVAPVGDTTEFRLASDWPHPSFTEAWSPDERRIGPDGFNATWRMTSVATGGQATWQKLAAEGKMSTAAGAGVSLFDPVNIYSLSYRATEYAFLFVLFTFGALALTEALAGVRLHIMQYTLIGSAIAIFFLLLLALSEHVPFATAYGSAATACVLLMTFYLRHPLQTLRRTTAFFGLFVALYSALYVLLKSEDNALLMGSLMVFGLLAVAMITTRKVDWGRTSERMSAPPAPASAA
jgi:inner membrane protein